MNILEQYASKGNFDGVLQGRHNKTPREIKRHNAIWAAQQGHVECVRALLNAGVVTKAYEVMKFAAMNEQWETLMFLSAFEDKVL